MCLHGFGVPEDLALAARLLIRGCDGGDGYHCNKAAILYDNGRGVPQNKQTAFDLFKKGCEVKLQSPDACTNLASYYEDGELVPKDLEKAKKLYSIGCSTTWSVTKEDACKKLKELSP
ncbi:MAG: tetratricopeptide repeat protein [Pyrinomonadaceae bacterium]